MVLVQVRMLPAFVKLRFGPGFWAFTFSWAATATDALQWIALGRPPGAAGYAIVIITAITAFVAVIAVRTVILIRRRQLLPEAIPNGRAVPPSVPRAGIASATR